MLPIFYGCNVANNKEMVMQEQGVDSLQSDLVHFRSLQRLV